MFARHAKRARRRGKIGKKVCPMADAAATKYRELTRTKLDALIGQGMIDGYDMRHAAQDGYSFKGITIKNCLVPRKSDLDGCKVISSEVRNSWLLNGCEVTDCILTNCIISGATINNSHLNLCVASQCEMNLTTGQDTIFARSGVDSMELRDCSVTDRCNFTACIFRDCNEARTCDLRKKIIKVCQSATSQRGFDVQNNG
jgi:uncharacterized protein YjbI with pentapeptide repeats